jgi:thiosulfate/3-mercaptopyruvate sulfurtransferase
MLCMRPLITVTELAAALRTTSPPVLLDVRWRLGGPPGERSYAAGHLAGAAHVDLDRELAAAPGPAGRHPLPGAEVFAAAMRRAGVSAGSDVVVYDDTDGAPAARAWWCLRYFGHEWVRVLDGGYVAWRAAGLPVATEVPAPLPGDFTSRPGDLPLLDADEAARLAREGRLLDGRTPERYRGEVEPIDPVAGHIPGAVSAPAAATVGVDGRLRAPEELRGHFADLGVTADVPTGAYCGSGVTAAHEVLALAVAGIPAALYVGSWSNWVADPGRPVATGADPG